VIRVYDAAGNVIETLEQTASSKSGEFNLSIALGALTQMWKEDYFRLFIAHVERP
jgi:hypothetical protein